MTTVYVVRILAVKHCYDCPNPIGTVAEWMKAPDLNPGTGSGPS